MLIPYFESISAWFPSPARDDTKFQLDFNTYLVDHPSSTFTVRVKWDSMKDAGIHENDLVIVDKSLKHKSWDIIIAQVDREFTLKYYMVDDKGRGYLQPANSDYPPIYPQEELIIFGVISAVVRKYT